MRATVWIFTIALGCGGTEPEVPTPDAPVAARSCRTFGPMTRQPALQTSSGAPLHPTGIVADPYAIYEDGHYRLWFTTVDWTAGSVFDATDRTLGTGYVESVDGVTWDDSALLPGDPAHKVDLVLEPDDWDAEGVETVSVARTGDGLVLFHTGDRSDGSNAIGRARSSDGLTWTREAEPVLLPEAAWEQPICLDEPTCSAFIGGMLEPAFLVDANGMQHVWYAAMGIRGDDLSMQIGHAFSADGIAWDRSPEPVFTPGGVGDWDEILVSHTNVVADPSGGYHLFYQGISRAQQDQCAIEGECPFYTPGSIGHAFSDDGTTWTRDPEPLLVPDASAGDGFFVGGPAAIIREGRVELFYFGIASKAEQTELRAHLGVATATCL